MILLAAGLDDCEHLFNSYGAAPFGAALQKRGLVKSDRLIESLGLRVGRFPAIWLSKPRNIRTRDRKSTRLCQQMD